MSPAYRIIEKFGAGHFVRGVAVVSELLGVHPSRVHRWTYPKSRGGTDGRIPAFRQQALLDVARKRGIALSPNDFFEASPKRGRAGGLAAPKLRSSAGGRAA